ncbi:hypothetical protein [Flindersiella endophytica]
MAAISRKAFLTLGTMGVAGLAGYGLSRPAPAEAADPVPAPDLGIAPGNSPQTNRVNLIGALGNSSGQAVTFPPGDYRIDNSGSFIVLLNYTGQWTMQAGARLVFTDPTRRGLNFQGGTGAVFSNLVATFTTLPTVRQPDSQEIVIFLETTDTQVNGANINGSAGAGLLFYHCARPRATNIRITNTMADGLHFANCQDGYADEVWTTNTGDDGLAFVNYAGGPAYTGGFASDITVESSKARGITVIGQSDVTIDHFGVNWSAVSGLKVGYESSYNTRVPTNVRFQNGFVYNGGALAGGQSGNTFGIEIDSAGEVFFSNVDVDRPGSRGVSSNASATVHLTDVVVTNAPSAGFNLQGGTFLLDLLQATDTDDLGYFVSDATRLQYGTLTARRTSKTATLHRAFDFERNAVVAGTHLYVVDDQATATGWIVGAYGTQSGNLGTIHDQVNSRAVEVQNGSGLTYTLV